MDSIEEENPSSVDRDNSLYRTLSKSHIIADSSQSNINTNEKGFDQ